MGLDGHAIRFLLLARARGADFSRTVTIGRQTVQVAAPALRQLLGAYSIHVTDSEAARLLTEADGFCEPLLRLLGATDVVSIDMSAYQNASVLHDMNDPVPDTLKDAATVVIDGGSLEHIFNFPRAIANCLEMIRPGGHFIGTSPANNFMGHGFYQFSPELFYRVFSAPNGFAVQHMVVYQNAWPNNAWYAVADPEDVRQRVTLVNREPTSLLVHAQKLRTVPPFEQHPQQSDYVAAWEYGSVRHSESAGAQPSRRLAGALSAALVRTLGRVTPAGLKRRWHDLRSGGDPFDPRLYRKLDP